MLSRTARVDGGRCSVQGSGSLLERVQRALETTGRRGPTDGCGPGGGAQTILKQYDGRFLQIFQEVYESTYKAKFEELGIWCRPCRPLPTPYAACRARPALVVAVACIRAAALTRV